MKTQRPDPSAYEESMGHLCAEQVSETIARSGLERLEFAESVGCGTSQLWKYSKEGLPPRMNREVRARILQHAARLGVLQPNAALRSAIRKLEKGI
jgi:hypothetical protein